MKRILFFIAMATIVACSPSYERTGLIIDGDKAVDVQFEEVATNIKVVPLLSDAPMEEFGTIQIHGDEMIIMDSNKRTVYYFLDNKLRSTLNAVGRGRGEYLLLNEVIYDNDKKILYLTQLTAREEILKYSVPDMKYVGTITVPSKVESIRLFDDKTLLLSMTKGDDEFGLYLFDIESEQIIKKVCDLNMYQYEQSNNTLSSFDKKSHLISLFGTTNRLCSYSDDSLTVKISFNYGGQGADYVYAADMDDSRDVDKYMEYLMANGDAYANFYFPREYEDGISFWYSTLRKKTKNFRFYRIKNNKEIHYKGFHIQGLSEPVYPVCSCDNWYVALFNKSAEEMKDPSVKPSKLAEKILNTVSNQTNDNPVIMYFDIRE